MILKLKRIFSVLYSEPEEWMSYMLGQRFAEVSSWKENPKRSWNLFLRLFAYCRHCLGNPSLNRYGAFEYTEILFFVASINQWRSLKPVYEEMKKNNRANILCTDDLNLQKVLENEKIEFIFYSLTLKETILLALIALIRLPRMLVVLFKKDYKLIQCCLEFFWEPIRYLILYDKFFVKKKVKSVIMSNDHNAPNRALRALATDNGIPTFYMQHAPISNLFPTLNFNFSLLDGEYSKKIYLDECAKNIFKRAHKISNPKILFVGRQHELGKSVSKSKRKIGIAINDLDDTDDVIALLHQLSFLGEQLVLRTHPRTSLKNCKLFEKMAVESKFTLSIGSSESSATFLSNIKTLIAGNSGILLESAIQGITPIYYQISKTNFFDYYGFVRMGLAKYISSLSSLKNFLKADESFHPTKASIQYYSATFGTEDFGKESRLAVKIIEQELHNLRLI